jgi:hypothetical protein
MEYWIDVFFLVQKVQVVQAAQTPSFILPRVEAVS